MMQAWLLQIDTDAEKQEGDREIRTSSLRIFADILLRFPEALDFNTLWPRFFGAAEAIIQRLPVEVRTAESRSSIEPCFHNSLLPLSSLLQRRTGRKIALVYRAEF